MANIVDKLKLSLLKRKVDKETFKRMDSADRGGYNHSNAMSDSEYFELVSKYEEEKNRFKNNLKANVPDKTNASINKSTTAKVKDIEKDEK